MIIGGMDLNVGDSLKYMKCTGGSGNSLKTKHREGIIVHITEKIITIDLGKYRDSFSIQDLTCGAVVIPGMNPISLTTSEVNTPYRVGMLTESNHSEYEKKPIKEEKPVKKKLTIPSNEELKRVYADGNQSIKFVMKFYGVSNTTAIKWLKGAGIYEPYANTKQKEISGTLDSNVDPNKTAATNPDPTTRFYQQNAKDTAANPTSKASLLVRKKDGNIDWDIMGPVVKAELDKGRPKYEVAAEFGITKPSINKHLLRRRRMEEKINPVVKGSKPENPPVSFEQYRLKTREELMTMRTRLQAEGEFIDIILSCIDRTLKEARKNAV